MTKVLSIDHPVLQKDILAIYQQHGMKGKPHNARRELAQKLNRQYITRIESIRAKVKQLREAGMDWTNIATEIGLTEKHVRNIWAYSQRLEKHAELAAKSVDCH